jgi:hypothetical protein
MDNAFVRGSLRCLLSQRKGAREGGGIGEITRCVAGIERDPQMDGGRGRGRRRGVCNKWSQSPHLSSPTSTLEWRTVHCSLHHNNSQNTVQCTCPTPPCLSERRFIFRIIREEASRDFLKSIKTKFSELFRNTKDFLKSINYNKLLRIVHGTPKFSGIICIAAQQNYLQSVCIVTD